MYNCVFILGPTASGKTSLSIKLAKCLNTEIINADSIQIYKHLNIGSAKATAVEQLGVKHHLLDFLEPTSEFSVSEYKNLAMPILTDLISKNMVPIVVGGTGFYVDSLINNYEYGNSVKDESIRAELTEIVKSKGNLYLHEMLKDIDPASAEEIHFNNVQRVIRAIEIAKITGKPKSMQNTMQKQDSPLKPLIIVLNWNREVLYNRINNRVNSMVNNGLIEEVDYLIKTFNLSTANQSFQGIGYKEIYEYLVNNANYDQVIDKLKQNTRNYAKRQITWFKRIKDAVWIDLDNISIEDAVETILKKLK